LENQERNFWTMLKIIQKKWVLEAWTKPVRDRDVCKLILKEARVVHGLYSQWRRRRRRSFFSCHIVTAEYS
jgi:hypothetical protein